MTCYRRSAKLMGCAFDLGVYAPDEATGQRWLQQGIDEISRLEALWSEFRPDSAISQLNAQADQAWVALDCETFGLLSRAQQISRLTRGYFDLTVGPLKRLYRFKKAHFAMPDRAAIQAALRQVGYRFLYLDPDRQRAKLGKKGMHLSLAAIGKGAAADCVQALWQQQGVQAGYVNASGDLSVFGQRPEGQPWTVAIAQPDDPSQVLLRVPMQAAAVATSGDAEQHFVYQGQRYSHNLDPKTGLPLQGLKSVSVFAPQAELSDALATAVYALGRERGLSLINQLPHTHAIVIDGDDRIHLSDQFEYEPTPLSSSSL